MEKYYLCSVQSKKDPQDNEVVIVLFEDIPEFVSSCVSPDSVVIISSCSTFSDKYRVYEK
nr:MAG TPA: hypothetical protein [Microviridae sp.]